VEENVEIPELSGNACKALHEDLKGLNFYIGWKQLDSSEEDNGFKSSGV